MWTSREVFFPSDSNNFLHRADQAQEFFLSHANNETETNAFVQKGVFISDNCHFVLIVALVKSSWPCLVYRKNFIECSLLLFVSHSASCTHALVIHQAQRSQSHLRVLQVVSKCNTNCSVSTVSVNLWHRNSSPDSEFKEFTLKLWDHTSLFLEFYLLFLKTCWKAYSEAVNQGQMDSVFSLFAYLHKFRRLLSVHLNRVK